MNVRLVITSALRICWRRRTTWAGGFLGVLGPMVPLTVVGLAGFVLWFWAITYSYSSQPGDLLEDTVPVLPDLRPEWLAVAGLLLLIWFVVGIFVSHWSLGALSLGGLLALGLVLWGTYLVLNTALWTIAYRRARERAGGAW